MERLRIRTVRNGADGFNRTGDTAGVHGGWHPQYAGISFRADQDGAITHVPHDPGIGSDGCRKDKAVAKALQARPDDVEPDFGVIIEQCVEILGKSAA